MWPTHSCGGLSTKIHATVDAMDNSTGFYLTPGQAHDLQGAAVLLKDTPAKAAIANKAYDAEVRVIEPLQKSRQDAGDFPAHHGARAYAITTAIPIKPGT